MSSDITEVPSAKAAFTTLDPCLIDRHWWVFLSSSLIVFVTLFVVVLVSRLVCWLVTRQTQRSATDIHTQIGWITEAKDWAGELISGQTKTGKILVSCYEIVSLLQLGQSTLPILPIVISPVFRCVCLYVYVSFFA